MKINEIDIVGDNTFPIKTAQHYLTLASPKGSIGEFTIHYAENANAGVIQIAVLLTDIDENIAAYVGFISRLNGRVWQARAAASYPPYSGQALVGKLYKHIKEQWKKSIQSDDVQTMAGKKLWTKILPGLGLRPMIYDTTTDQIIDPETTKINIYPDPDDSDVSKYCWILEKFDHYPEQNLLVEGSLLMPHTGLWFKENRTSPSN